MSPKASRSAGLRWTTNRFGTSVRSAVARRSASMARSIRRWSWSGWSLARNRRAVGRSKSRSKNRSMAANGGMVGRRLAEGPPGARKRLPCARGGGSAGPSAGVRGTPGGGAKKTLRYTLAPVRLERRSNASSALPGDRMPEILTESFCERCGTRYTFESAAPKGARLKGFKTVSRGLRNFVMSDDTSMDEAMAAARNETDREATSQQLDAFHKTFNFCMSCRQYTCSNCWNEVEGRCLSCAPSLGTEVLPAPFPNLDTSLPFGTTGLIGDTENGHDHTEAPASEPMSWPTSDLMRDEEAAPADFEDLLARREAETAIEDDDSFDP